jgi:hypothetical protein
MTPLVDPREKAKKELSSLSTPGDRFDYWLSQITSPFVVGLGVLGYVSLDHYPSSRWPAVAHGHRLFRVGHADHALLPAIRANPTMATAPACTHPIAICFFASSFIFLTSFSLAMPQLTSVADGGKTSTCSQNSAAC